MSEPAVEPVEGLELSSQPCVVVSSEVDMKVTHLEISPTRVSRSEPHAATTKLATVSSSRPDHRRPPERLQHDVVEDVGAPPCRVLRLDQHRTTAARTLPDDALPVEQEVHERARAAGSFQETR